MKAACAAYSHRDDDDAGLSDDFLHQLVEGGVEMVDEGLQLLHPVVQLDVGSRVLAEGAVYCR